MSLLLLILLVVFLFGGLPNWGYHSYGYAPSGIVGVVLIVVLIMFLTGRL
jgi:uncharacterized protein DUF3309